jgi:purine-binding chemotaxis protein CheW
VSGKGRMKIAPVLQGQKQFCTFSVDSFLLGIEAIHVREIIRAHGITSIPLAPPAVRGLMNLRGEIITVLDLRRCLGLPEARADQPLLTMVLHYQETVVGLLIDRVVEVLVLQEGDFEPVPETLQGAAKQWVQGVYKLKTGLLGVLNLDRLSKETSF